jgi:hypothetical protein
MGVGLKPVSASPRESGFWRRFERAESGSHPRRWGMDGDVVRWWEVRDARGSRFVRVLYRDDETDAQGRVARGWHGPQSDVLDLPLPADMGAHSDMLAPSNAPPAMRAGRLCKRYGGQMASPAETRMILGLPPFTSLRALVRRA